MGNPMKTIEQHFIDWESDVFGFGYGSGEPEIIPVIKKFFAAIPKDGPYDYRLLGVSPSETWLLINTFCHEDLIEYGSSPRFGWLTKKGKVLKQFMYNKTPEEMLDILGGDDENYFPCMPDYCNCDLGGPCKNPFWEN
jgi:hypothetical protein